jgi:excisionase family DNA binding protein
MTLAQAANACGLSPTTLRVQIRNGRIVASKLGRDWIVSSKALQTYLKGRAPQGRRAKQKKAR